MTRDLTAEQFAKALARHGFSSRGGFMGYVSLPAPHQNTGVSILNAGSRRRDQLAYLLRELDKVKREAEQKENR